MRNRRYLEVGIVDAERPVLLLVSRWVLEQLLSLSEATEGRVDRRARCSGSSSGSERGLDPRGLMASGLSGLRLLASTEHGSCSESPPMRPTRIPRQRTRLSTAPMTRRSTPSCLLVAGLLAPAFALAAPELTVADAIRAAWTHDARLQASSAQATSAARGAEAADWALGPTLDVGAVGTVTSQPSQGFSLLLDQGQVTAADFVPSRLNTPTARGGLGLSAVLEQPLIDAALWAARRRAHAGAEAEEATRAAMQGEVALRDGARVLLGARRRGGTCLRRGRAPDGPGDRELRPGPRRPGRAPAPPRASAEHCLPGPGRGRAGCRRPAARAGPDRLHPRSSASRPSPAPW